MASLPAPPPRPARPAVWALLTVILAAGGAYLRTLGYDLVWDDLGLLAYLDSVGEGVGSLLRAEFRLDAPYGYYRPVVLLSLVADRALDAGSLPFHLQNVLLHAACSGLVFQLARAVLPGLGAPLLAGLVFAWHPTHVESVAFVSGRTDLWSALFLLISTWAFLRGGARPARPLVIGGSIALLLALLAKEVAVMLPLVLAAWAFLDRSPAPGGSDRRLRRWMIGWVGALVAWGALRLAAGVGLGLLGSADAAVDQVAPLRDDPGLLLPLWLTYDRLLVWPWPLSAFYTREDLGLLWPAVCSALLTTACVVTFSRRHDRLGWKTGVWIVAFLLPVGGLVPLRGAVLAERFLYVPSVGYALLAGYLGAWLWHVAADRPRLRTAGRTLVTAGLAALLLVTVLRTPVWRGEIPLFESIVRSSPRAVLAYNNLAAAYGRAGRVDEAVDLLEQAVQIRPDYVEAWTNLGFARRRRGNLPGSIAAYRQAVHHNPRYVRARFDLAVTALQQGDRDEVQRQIEALRGLDAGAATRLAEMLRRGP